jgi:hypothetical protein
MGYGGFACKLSDRLPANDPVRYFTRNQEEGLAGRGNSQSEREARLLWLLALSRHGSSGAWATHFAEIGSVRDDVTLLGYQALADASPYGSRVLRLHAQEMLRHLDTRLEDRVEATSVASDPLLALRFSEALWASIAASAGESDPTQQAWHASLVGDRARLETSPAGTLDRCLP